jgi:Cellulose binding domain
MSPVRARAALGAGLAAVLAVAGAVVALVTAPSAGAATGCQASYRVNEWSGGFVGYVDITAGSSAVHGWQVTWNYTGGQKVTSFWNAQITQSGTAVSASNLSYNADIPAGGTLEFGLQGTWSGSDPAPTDITVTGTGCASSTPSTGPTSASPVRSSASPSQGISPSASRTSVTPSQTVSTPPAGGCGSAKLCDGFENLAAGTPSGSWQPAYPNCSGSGTATIDTSTAHSGSKSLRINGAAGYCNHVFATPTTSLASVGAVWYVRFYVRHTTALPASHVAFLAMKDSADGGNDLRFGGQNGALQWNRQSDDATLPEQSPTGVSLSAPLPVNTWSCVELLVDGSNGTIDTWLNGGEIAGLHEDGTPTADVDRQWLSRTNWRPSLTDLRLGWEAYGDGSDTLWFDDVVVGSSRTGC